MLGERLERIMNTTFITVWILNRVRYTERSRGMSEWILPPQTLKPPEHTLRDYEPRLEGLYIHGLGNVVIRARIQHLYQVIVLVLGSHHEDKPALPAGHGPHLAAELKPAHPRQHPVQYHERVLVIRKHLQRALRVLAPGGPEFSANEKEGVLVRHVMSHSAGLSGFDPPIEANQLYDWDAVVSGLAAQRPWWAPGEGSGYHAITQGFLQGEIIRRVTGKSIGTFFREEIAEPLGADFHIGLNARHDPRVGDLVPPGTSLASTDANPDSIAARTMRSCNLNGTEPATEDWRRAEIPAAGGIGNARSVARVHSLLACGGEVDGIRLLRQETINRILEEQTNGTDKVLGVPVRFGMGFGLIDKSFPLSPNERAFFWGGWGGSIAVIDLDARVSIAYVMNRMEANLMGDVRGGALVLTAFGCLQN